MEKELFEQIVMSVCKSESKTKAVMNIVYGIPKHQDKEIGSFKRCQNKHFYRKELTECPYCEPTVIESKEVSKKQELIDSLDYLKKKEHKTDKDKESISIIQAILNGMK